MNVIPSEPTRSPLLKMVAPNENPSAKRLGVPHVVWLLHALARTLILLPPSSDTFWAGTITLLLDSLDLYTPFDRRFNHIFQLSLLT